MINLLKFLFGKLLKPQLGAKLFSKGMFVMLYVTNNMPKESTFCGKKFDTLNVLDGYPNKGEIAVSLGYCYLLGVVRRGTFHITYMVSSDNSLAGSRNVMRVIDYLMKNYKSIDPGSMSIYSARLYWSCIRRMK